MDVDHYLILLRVLVVNYIHVRDELTLVSDVSFDSDKILFQQVHCNWPNIPSFHRYTCREDKKGLRATVEVEEITWPLVGSGRLFNCQIDRNRCLEGRAGLFVATRLPVDALTIHTAEEDDRRGINKTNNIKGVKVN